MLSYCTGPVCFEEVQAKGGYLIEKISGGEVLNKIGLMQWSHGVQIKIEKGKGRLGNYKGYKFDTTFELDYNLEYDDIKSKIPEIQTQINQHLSKMKISTDDHCTLYTYPTDPSYVPINVKAYIW